MLELAIGDAYGAGFEFRTRPHVRACNRVERYHRQPLSVSRAGRYMDDTQMSIAVAEVLVAGDEWTPEVLAECFVRAFKRDARTGYAARFHHFLAGVRDGADFLARIRPTSERSGAAMRAGPIGLVGSVDEVLARAAVQARLTHDTAGGVASAQAAALMVHHSAHGLGSPATLPAFVAEHVPGDWRTPWRGRVSIDGIPCVRAALTAVAECTSLRELLRRCVAWSGDTDTVATIALASASWSTSYAQDLPVRLVDDLEDGPYGRDFLRALDADLQAFLARQRPSAP